MFQQPPFRARPGVYGQTHANAPYQNRQHHEDEKTLSQMDMFNKMKSNLIASYPPPGMIFDGKRMRKAVSRKSIDYSSSVCKWLQNRIWQRDYRDMRANQPDYLYITDFLPPTALEKEQMNVVTTKFIRQSTNKIKCPIFSVCWVPDGRRLITGASSGEFTLWNGVSFNFETILQAHDAAIRAMVWSNNERWLVSADNGGYIKYWQSNMNNVKMYQAHREAIRGLSFCPTDAKFATCSDDGTVRIFDFAQCYEEMVLRGHGADVKCVQWHPQKSIIVSGSKDSQQPIKFWDPKSGQGLFTLYAHKNTCTDVRWNRNGNWLLTSSRDHLIKLFDLRNLKEECQTFKGHKREATCVAWHPVYESMFSSAGGDGSIMFWIVGFDKEVGGIDEAHDNYIWSMQWHPLGHILASGANDHSTKFWTRSRPGDLVGEKFQTNISFAIGGANASGPNPLDMSKVVLSHNLPIAGLDLVAGSEENSGMSQDGSMLSGSLSTLIPGLGGSGDGSDSSLQQSAVGSSYRRPMKTHQPPKNFALAWESDKVSGIMAAAATHSDRVDQKPAGSFPLGSNFSPAMFPRFAPLPGGPALHPQRPESATYGYPSGFANRPPGPWGPSHLPPSNYSVPAVTSQSSSQMPGMYLASQGANLSAGVQHAGSSSHLLPFPGQSGLNAVSADGRPTAGAYGAYGAGPPQQHPGGSVASNASASAGALSARPYGPMVPPFSGPSSQHPLPYPPLGNAQQARPYAPPQPFGVQPTAPDSYRFPNSTAYQQQY